MNKYIEFYETILCDISSNARVYFDFVTKLLPIINIEENYDDSSYTSTMDTIKTCYEFLKKYSKPYADMFSKRISDGTVDLKYEWDEHHNYCTTNYPHIDINVFMENKYSDSLMLIHEFIHSTNESYNERNTRYLLTEMFSYIYELLLSSELLENDKAKKSVLKNYSDILKNVKECGKQILVIIPALESLKLSGKLNDNYIKYGEKILDEDLKGIMNVGPYRLFTLFGYVIGYSLATYIVSKINANPSYINKIIKINNNLDNMSYSEVLNELEIDFTDENCVKEILDCVKKSTIKYKGVNYDNSNNRPYRYREN